MGTIAALLLAGCSPHRPAGFRDRNAKSFLENIAAEGISERDGAQFASTNATVKPANCRDLLPLDSTSPFLFDEADSSTDHTFTGTVADVMVVVRLFFDGTTANAYADTLTHEANSCQSFDVYIDDDLVATKSFSTFAVPMTAWAATGITWIEGNQTLYYVYAFEPDTTGNMGVMIGPITGTQDEALATVAPILVEVDRTGF